MEMGKGGIREKIQEAASVSQAKRRIVLYTRVMAVETERSQEI